MIGAMVAGTELDGLRNSSGSGQLSEVVSTMLSWLAPVLLAIILVIALTFFLKKQFLSAVVVLGAGGIMAIFLFSFPSIFFEDPEGSGGSARPTATPEPSAVEEVAPSSPPADLTGLWLTLGVIGAVALIGLIVTGWILLLRRSRRDALELDEKRAALAAERAKALAVWQKSVDKHEELKAKALQIELDWDMLFSYPALLDPSVPQTRDFHRAMETLDSTSTEAPADISLSMDIGALPYPKLVAEAGRAWGLAWGFAQRVGTKLIPRAERKKVDQIVKLLRLARDGGGSEHERSIAYERATKLISELHFVHVPEKALQAIGAEARLMIEAPADSGDKGSREGQKVAIAL